ncbi:MAG: hypothetical protein QM572_15585 [Nocardioides sp.]|uniref:hypothetical protein n=1 Tax=Nocardioides sp. TaxID=35761 RepID=UPI0039E3F0C5
MFRRLSTVAVATLATTSLALATTTPADAASIASTTSESDTTYTVVAKNFDDNVAATITLRNALGSYAVTVRTETDEDGKLTYTFAPPSAGKYVVRFSADGETAKKTIKVGTAYGTKITIDADDTSDKTTTISGTAAAGSTILLKVYDPSGHRDAVKRVAVASDGTWTTTFHKATDEGEYDVTATYVATDLHYGVKTYTDSFDRD